MNDVVQCRLCVGCGVCAYICRDKNVFLVDIVQDGIRPRLDLNRCTECGECVNVCPGYQIIHETTGLDGAFPELKSGWGQFLKYGKDLLVILISDIAVPRAVLQAPLPCIALRRRE